MIDTLIKRKKSVSVTLPLHKLAVALIPIFLIGSHSLEAQESSPLELSDQDALRLGIYVDAVGLVPEGVGISAPARVIANPNEGSHLYAIIDGNLANWEVDLGEAVQQGQLVATLQSAEVSELQTQWLDANSNLHRAEIESERLGRLFEQGVISERRLQISNIATNRAQSLEAMLAQSMQRIGFRENDLEKLASSNQNLGLALLRAPHAGTLVHKAILSNEPVMAGEELAEIESNSRKWVSLSVSSRLASGLPLGTPISIENGSAKLTLKQRDYSADPRTQTIELFAEFNSDVGYLLGTTLQALIEPDKSGVLVPATAVVFSEGQSIVYVRKQGQFVPRALELSPLGKDYSVSSGLAVGEVIAVRGAALLKGMQLGLGGDA